MTKPSQRQAAILLAIKMDLADLHLPNPFQPINLAYMILLEMLVNGLLIPIFLRRHDLITLKQTRLANTALDRMSLRVRILDQLAALNCAPRFVMAVIHRVMMLDFGLPAIYKPAILVWCGQVLNKNLPARQQIVTI